MDIGKRSCSLNTPATRAEPKKEGGLNQAPAQDLSRSL